VVFGSCFSVQRRKVQDRRGGDGGGGGEPGAWSRRLNGRPSGTVKGDKKSAGQESSGEEDNW
jgi:hypothetical protein